MSDFANELRAKARELLALADKIEADTLIRTYLETPAQARKRFLLMLAAEGVSLPEAKQ